MTLSKTIIIALGSNKGNKFENLQEALVAMHKTLGTIKKISKVYRSPAVGFEGDEFLNACVKLTTQLKPKKILKHLFEIETKGGRVRTEGKDYESRTIDLDLLFYDDQVIKTETLQVPHPRLQDRKFVLLPMQDIDPKWKHPVLKKTMVELLEICEDNTEVLPQNIWLKNPLKNYCWSQHNFIAIEGNIGAGKTSLATQISEDFNAKLILERFADNPFLPKFYKEPQRYAFTLEMSFLADRYQQISEDLSQLDLFKDFIVSDYDVHKSLIFSRVTLPEDEFMLYRKLFYQVYRDLAKPDLYVYLYQNTERLQKNIKKRGRNYEQDIQDEYLDKINAGYLEFLRNQTDLNVKIIDISNRDFVKHREDYLWLLEEICG